MCELQAARPLGTEFGVRKRAHSHDVATVQAAVEPS